MLKKHFLELMLKETNYFENCCNNNNLLMLMNFFFLYFFSSVKFFFNLFLVVKGLIKEDLFKNELEDFELFKLFELLML